MISRRSFRLKHEIVLVLLATILPLFFASSCGVIDFDQIAGSENNGSDGNNTLTLKKGEWSTAGSLITGGFYTGAWKMSDGNYLAIMQGAWTEPTTYDPISNSWELRSKYQSAGVIYRASCRIAGTDTVLHVAEALSSFPFSGVDYGASLIYDYSADVWTRTSDYNKARVSFERPLCMDNGKAMLLGGKVMDDTLGYYTDTDTVEIFDPSSGTWSIMASMNWPRIFPAAVLLNDGRILAVGGMDIEDARLGPAGEFTAEVYDPETDTWELTGNLNGGRSYAEAVLLDDGRVLVAGGWLRGTGYLDTAEVYDPATNEWTVTGAMNYPRRGFNLIRLADGNVMAVGGRYQDEVWETIETDSGPIIKSISMTKVEIWDTAEIYDVATGVWNEVASMKYKREYAFGVLMDNGNVMVGGGWDSSDARYDTVEIYVP